MTLTVRLRFLAAAALVAAATPAMADWQVWTTTQTRWVLREDAAGKNLPVELSAARNEWRGFQILLRSDSPISDLDLKAGDLAGPEGAVLRGSDARLYRQHQLHVTQRTVRNDEFRPGWYPDPLVPFVHPLTGKPLAKARLTAAPFDLPANQTHGYWVDLYVPAGAKAGTYRGAYQLTAAQGKAIEIPVTLRVWNFGLPATPTLQTSLGSPAGQLRTYYARQSRKSKLESPKDWAAVERQCAAMLSEHRINATPSVPFGPIAEPDGTFRIPEDQIRALREFIDTYHVNAISTTHPRSAVKDPDQQRKRLHAWLAAFDRAAAELDRPGVTLYTYLKDEPNTEPDYRYVQKWGKAIRAAKSALKVLVVEQTKTQDPAWGDLNGAVDIWCPLFSLHDEETSAQRRALGETIWTYTALCQGPKTPWWHIDYPLLHYRAPQWIAWRYRMRGLLYWGGMAHWSGVDDPWTDPWTYGRRGDRRPTVYNGEGTIVYPGEAVGYDGIAASLRLKALRDGIEDFEYLSILDRLGRTADAEKLVLPLAGSWFKWDPDPKAYDQTRAKLAAMIEDAQQKAAR